MPGAVFNYVSGRTQVLLNNGKVNSFDTYHVKLVERGIVQLKAHKPTQSLPLKMQDGKISVKDCN